VPELNEMLAFLYELENDLDNAEKFYSREIELNDNSWKSLGGLGSIYLRKGKFLEAEKVFLSACLINPATELKMKLAQAYQGLNKLDEACAVYDILLSDQKSSFDNEAFYSFSKCYFNAGRIKSAQSLLKKYFDGGGRSINALQLFIKVNLEVSDYHLLGDVLDCLATQQGNDVSVHVNVSDFLTSTKQKDEVAMDILTRALKIDPLNTRANASIASMYVRRNLYSEAAKYFDLALQIDGNNIFTLFNYASSQRSARNFTESASLLKKLFSLDCNWPDAYLLYSEVLLELHDFKEAEIAADQAIALKVDKIGVAYHVKSAYLFSKGNYSDSLSFIKLSLMKNQCIYNSLSMANVPAMQ